MRWHWLPMVFGCAVFALAYPFFRALFDSILGRGLVPFTSGGPPWWMYPGVIASLGVTLLGLILAVWNTARRTQPTWPSVAGLMLSLANLGYWTILAYCVALVGQSR